MVEEDRGGEVETQAAEGRKAGDTINERREPGQRECRASDIFSSIVALIVGISWPVTLIILIILFYEHLPSLRTLTSGLRQVFPDRTISKVEAGLGPKGIDFTLEMAAAVAAGVRSQPSTAGGKTDATVSPATAKELSIGSVSEINRFSATRPGPTANILWVDPHPANNIGLQYSFQSLGMVVMTIQDDDGIEP
jgi:hypothetical protein